MNEYSELWIRQGSPSLVRCPHQKQNLLENSVKRLCIEVGLLLLFYYYDEAVEAIIIYGVCKKLIM